MAVNDTQVVDLDLRDPKHRPAGKLKVSVQYSSPEGPLPRKMSMPPPGLPPPPMAGYPPPIAPGYLIPGQPPIMYPYPQQLPPPQ